MLKTEIKREETIQCHESYEHISISLLLDGYTRKEERFREYEEFSRQFWRPLVLNPSIVTNLEANQVMKSEQKTDVSINVNIDLKIDLPQIQTDFENSKQNKAFKSRT